MREKLKDYSFWVGVVGSVMVLLHTINSQLNIEYIENVIMALLGVLSVAGIVHKPSAKTLAKDNEKQNGEPQIFEKTNDKQKDCNTQNCEKVNDETQIFEKANGEKSSEEQQNETKSDD
ncbi:MAG: hypothetical protein RR416_01625 [Clostridia bacterium]